MTQSRRFALGIDISKADFHVALVPADGNANATVLGNATFDNTPTGFRKLNQWLKSCSKALLKGEKKGSVTLQFHACMEASGYYGNQLAFYLHDRFAATPHRVSVVRGQLPKAFMQSTGQRTKTDKQDAIGIARYCAAQTPEPWQPPTPDQQELKALTRYVDELKTNITQERNRLQGVTSSAVRKQIKEHIAFLEKQIKELDVQTQDLLKKSQSFSEPLRLLLSIPAIGMVTAAHILAEIPDINHFHTAAQLVAYAGLNPTQHQSGTSVNRKSRVSKQGNQHLRTALFMPALVAMQGCNTALNPLIDRLVAAGRPHLVAVGAAMRKLLHIIFGVLKSGKPFDPNYLKNAQCA
jgi:transposase